MLILITAINGISKELYESATIDGAGEETASLYHHARGVATGEVHSDYHTVSVFQFQFYHGARPCWVVRPTKNRWLWGCLCISTALTASGPRSGIRMPPAIIMLVITAAVSLLANKLMSRGTDIHE